MSVSRYEQNFSFDAIVKDDPQKLHEKTGRNLSKTRCKIFYLCSSVSYIRLESAFLIHLFSLPGPKP